MLTKKLILQCSLLFSLIIVLFNFTTIPNYIGLEPIIHVYTYENNRGEEIKHVPEKMGQIDYAEPGLKRKFKLNYLKFWKWAEYMTHPRWELDYYK